MRNEIYKLDKTQYEPLIGAINSFQSSKDIDAFIREKVFEIVKIKMLVEQEQDNKRIADSLALSEKIRNLMPNWWHKDIQPRKLPVRYSSVNLPFLHTAKTSSVNSISKTLFNLENILTCLTDKKR